MKRISITEKLILWFLLICLAAIAIVAGFSYVSSRKVLLDRTYNQLTSVRLAKQSNIEHFFDARMNEAKLIIWSEKFKGAFDLLSRVSEKLTAKDIDEIKKRISAQYSGYLEEFLAENSYYSGIVIGTNNNMVLISKPDSGSDPDIQYDEYDQYGFLAKVRDEVINSRMLSVIDYSRITDSVFFPVLISARVSSSDSGRNGFIALQINPEAIDDIMLEKDPLGGLGKSGESYLVGQDFYMRSRSRFIGRSVNEIMVNTAGVQDALNGDEGIMRFDDYRGIDVLNSHGPLKVPGLNWVIMAEIDYSEAMIPLTMIRNEILVLTVFLALIVFVAIILIARKISKPIVTLTNTAKKIGAGDFDVKVEIKSTDEIGVLTAAFNDMCLKLSKMTNELKEREERLKHFYDATIDGILLQEKGQTLLVNQSLTRLTGFDEEELMAMSFDRIIKDAAKCPPHILDKPYTCQTSLQMKDGNLLPVEIQFSIVEFRGKQVIASVIRDISERVTIEEELRNERLRRLSAVIDGQEIERERLSRELHDGLGQEIIAMKLQLENALGDADARTQNVIRELRDAFDKTIDEIRRISNDLMPGGLVHFGLENALKKLGSDVSVITNKSISVQIENLPPDLNSKVILYLFRIAQEAVNNAVKHSNAGSIDIKLSGDTSDLFLSIKDNGCGFDQNKLSKFPGNGIYNMRERANLLHGKLEIASGINCGTLINVVIPLNQK